MTTTPSPTLLAVTFDFGQTLSEIDRPMLVARLAERGLVTTEEALEASSLAAWREYDAAILAGHGGHPWKHFMTALLAGAGLTGEPARAAVDWLWSEQPARNLWRHPMPGMLELVRDLRDAGVPFAVISNSEGHLAAFIEETPFAGLLPIVADSGALGLEKPGREIFEWTAARLGVPLDRIAHVGDSQPADVGGALAAGMYAVWFQPRSDAPLDARTKVATNAAEVRRALVEWGVALPG